MQETKEALAGAFALVEAVKKAGQDGYSFDDLFSYMADGPLKDALHQAFEGAQHIDDEVREMSLLDAFQLVQYLADRASKLL